tara:strand:- start:60 stop:377 length:318 start_codon:yes stop_codon:yes gene_type:complete
MTWKDILKIDMKEARRLGEKYAPEEMGRGPTRDNGMMSELERRVQSVKSAPPGLQRRSALQLLRDAAERAGMPDASTKSLAEISNFVREMKVRSKGNQSNSGTAA